ncbi:MAG TPA: glycosyltransferase, partial [Candidatus Paceibacterota bacterium]|nr:glycosyltransferase [Candidatus Paceibacterota bacterium]
SSGIFHKIAKYLFIYLAFWKAKKLHKKYNFEIIWSLMATYGGFSALFFKRKYSNIKFLLTLQEGDSKEHIFRRLGIFKNLYKEIFKRADVVQVISNYLGDFAKDMGYVGIPVVIPNAVDIDLFSREVSEEEVKNIRNEFTKNNELILVTSSRLVEKNGLEYVIRAMRELPNYVFVILGIGELENKLKGLVKNLGLEKRVFFKGFVLHKDLPKYLKASDIFIRPSLSEGLGNSFLEAMASGLPAIATPVGGIPDFLEENKTGVFCKPKDVESIISAVKKLEDNSLQSLIIQNASIMVREKYTWDKIVIKIKEIL